MYSTESCEDWTSLVLWGVLVPGLTEWPPPGLWGWYWGGCISFPPRARDLGSLALRWGTYPHHHPKRAGRCPDFLRGNGPQEPSSICHPHDPGEAISAVPLSTGTWGLMLWGGQHVPITSPREWINASTLTSMGNWLCLTKPWITHEGMLSSKFFLKWIARSVPCGFVGGATTPWGARVPWIEKLQSWSWVPDQRVLNNYPLRPSSLKTEFLKP